MLTGESTIEDAGGEAGLARGYRHRDARRRRCRIVQPRHDDTFACEPVANPVDTTGAGDLLTAAYIWADLRGAEPAERLRWAVLYATLAVNAPTGIGGAVSEAELMRAGNALDLVPPPLAGTYAG